MLSLGPGWVKAEIYLHDVEPRWKIIFLISPPWATNDRHYLFFSYSNKVTKRRNPPSPHSLALSINNTREKRRKNAIAHDGTIQEGRASLFVLFDILLGVAVLMETDIFFQKALGNKDVDERLRLHKPESNVIDSGPADSNNKHGETYRQKEAFSPFSLDMQ